MAPPKCEDKRIMESRKDGISGEALSKRNGHKNNQKRRPTATNRDIVYALTVYFFLPLAVLMVTTKCHQELHVVVFHPDEATTMATTANHRQSIAISEWLLSSRILLLGFPNPQKLWSTLYERVVSVTCWGITFLMVRKGWNPETRGAGNLSKRWKGTVLSTLMVFYSTFGRTIVKRNHLFFCSSPFCDALLVGISWGTSSALIRRRLDPALRDNLWRRAWKDLLCGSLSLSIGSYTKGHFSPYLLPIKGFLEETFPIDPATARVFEILFGIPHERFWHVAIDACQIAFWWGVPYLLVRRGCNPDSRATFVTKFGRDALYGSYALVVYVYLKLAVKKWLPLLVWQWSQSWTLLSPFQGKDDSSSDEL